MAELTREDDDNTTVKSPFLRPFAFSTQLFVKPLEQKVVNSLDRFLIVPEH